MLYHFHKDEEKTFKHKYRAHIEHYDGRLKSFGVLKETFWHKGGPVSGDRFKKCMENGFPLYEP